jgi:tight adherence protein B
MELLIAVTVFVLPVLLGVAISRRRGERYVEDQLLSRIVPPVVKPEPDQPAITRESGPSEWRLGIFFPGVPRLLSWVQGLLTQAAIHAAASDVVILTISLAGVGAVWGWLWNGGSLVAAAAPPIGLGAAPLLYILWRRRQRLRAFDLQLPEVLDMLKASLEAGHTLQRALQVGVDEFSEPAAAELRIVLEQNRLGVPLERSLELMLERLPDDNLRFLVMAVKIQAQAGTSLARIIGELARTVRDRHRMEMRVRVLTAQPRITGIAAGFMPILLALGMYFINPPHVQMLLFDPAGVLITKLAIVLEVTAFAVIYRMVRLDY